MRSKRCSRRSRRNARTRSGAWATSSATGRGRTSAARAWPGSRRLPDRQPRPRRARGISTWTSSPRGRRQRALDAGRARRREPLVPLVPLAGRRASSGVELYHASPRDPVWEYVLDAGSMRARSRSPSSRSSWSVTATCRSRAPRRRDSSIAAHAPAGTEVDLSAGRVLLNPGSVGQPRDGDPRAAFVLLDLAARQRLPPRRLRRRADAGGDQGGGTAGGARRAASARV